MKFMRGEKYQARTITPRIYSAAVRAVHKERARAGLFGEELMRFKTPEERLSQMAHNVKHSVEYSRQYEARGWRRGRRELDELSSALKKAVLKRWNSNIPQFNSRRCASTFSSEIRLAKIMPERRYLALAGIREAVQDIKWEWGDDLLDFSRHRVNSIRTIAKELEERTDVKLSTISIEGGAFLFLLRDLEAAHSVLSEEPWIVSRYNTLVQSACPSLRAADLVEVVRVDYRPTVRESIILGNTENRGR